MRTTMGAPQRCVTRAATNASAIASAETSRRQTFAPPTAGSVQGKPQPLQWNLPGRGVKKKRKMTVAGRRAAHGQRPEVAAGPVAAEAPEVDGVAEREDVGAAVVEHDALGPARRARRVVDRERVPLVPGAHEARARVAGRDEGLVGRAGPADDDEARRVRERRERGAVGARVARVGDEDARLAVLEHVGDGRRVEPSVDAA